MSILNKLDKQLYFRFPSKKPPVCSAVIVAAGKGERMQQDKTIMDLCGKPVIVRAIEPFQTSTLIDEIIVVTSSDKIEMIADICRKYRLDKVKKVISGGATRTESSLAGVCETRKGAKLIAIHDCARPLVTGRVIMDTVIAAANELAAIPGIPSTDTLKKINARYYINGKINRDEVVRVQTPQVFDADLIKGALTDAVRKRVNLTDDSSAVERAGFKVKVVEGDRHNIKLTTKEDVIYAETIIRERGE